MHTPYHEFSLVPKRPCKHEKMAAYPGVRRKCHDDLLVCCSSTIEFGNIWGSHLVLRSLQFEEVEGQHPTRVALLYTTAGECLKFASFDLPKLLLCVA
jgi:hypothetical protein